ncbi:hypothetical protein [Ruicaihuangia caeni]|uniref:DUF1795 domain-containing protein n=1 Tax=Ruicaihuangia caeni TaxID=3042517 RepID=A0AAW6TBX0_9MICO|nr:hypothetical protein [Klugiella sp. YN-L-19]MDI2098537.1 hypothetical protein [Klugiella sp. YN-L-19]
MTRAVTVGQADFTIVLPGTWASIPLHDAEAADRAVVALVKQRVGRDDRLATARRQARDQLRDVVQRARADGAMQLALSLEILPDVPFPASMIMKFVPWSDAVSPDDRVSDALRKQLPGAEVLELEPGPTARTWRSVQLRPGSEPVPDLKLEYLLPTADGTQLLQLVADVPVECDPELLVALFDAIVDSIRWYRADAAPSSAPGRNAAPEAEPEPVER